MKLVTYYGLLQPKTLYRIVVDDDDLRGYYQHPGDPRWHWTGSVAYEIQQNGAIEISRSDARAILSVWQGELDELDEYDSAAALAEVLIPDELAEEFPPFEVPSVLSFPIAAMVPPPSETRESAGLDLWLDPGLLGSSDDLQDPPPASSEEEDFLAAFEGGMQAIEPVPDPAPATSEPAASEVVPSTPAVSPPPPPRDRPVAAAKPRSAPARPAPEVDLSDTEEEGHPAMARKDAMAALRDLADGLSSLGTPGMSWT